MHKPYSPIFQNCHPKRSDINVCVYGVKFAHLSSKFPTSINLKVCEIHCCYSNSVNIYGYCSCVFQYFINFLYFCIAFTFRSSFLSQQTKLSPSLLPHLTTCSISALAHLWSFAHSLHHVARMWSAWRLCIPMRPRGWIGLELMQFLGLQGSWSVFLHHVRSSIILLHSLCEGAEVILGFDLEIDEAGVDFWVWFGGGGGFWIWFLGSSSKFWNVCVGAWMIWAMQIWYSVNCCTGGS